jgi:glycosyltransferase involved in cell wall biosynthesis
MKESAGNSPLVSVVMAVHNAEKYVEKSIGSILNQTFQDFEFIIINDGSTDRTASILNALDEAHQRIKVIHQEKRGLTPTLNLGCNLAQGKYIARMDADDLSLPERFARQIIFLEAHPEIAVCGSWVKKIGKSRRNLWRYPGDSDVARCHLLFNNPIAHPVAMIRRDAIAAAGFYDESYLYAADYACWAKIAERRSIANIPEVLLHYRIHFGQMGMSYSDDLRAAEYKKVQTFQLERLGLSPTSAEIDLQYFLGIVKLATTPVRPRLDLIEEANKWLLRIKESNKVCHIFPEPALSQVLSTHWYLLCRSNTKIGLGAWRAYRRSPLYVNHKLELKRKAAFVLKSALRYDVNNRQLLLKAALKFFALQQKLGIG